MIYIKKIVKVLMSWCMVLSLIFTNTYAVNDSNKKNKAIIFVPGVLTSGLFYNDKSNFKYYKNESVWLGVSDSKIRTLKAAFKFLLYRKDLFCDEKGAPLNKHVGLSRGTSYAYESDSKIAKFGVLNLCEKLISELDKNFGESKEEYKIVFHNYDWRIDCAENSKLLTKEIMKYDEVILIGYSLGGLISCKSAAELNAKNELHRIKAFISIAVPYNGAADVLCVLEKGMVTGYPIMDKMAKLTGIPGVIKELSCNCIPAYQLMPTRKFFEKSKDGFVCEEKNKLLSYYESMKLLKSRPWGKKSNGANKDFFEKAENFHKSLYVDGNHIVNMMNSYFIAGSGIKTKSKILINGKTKNSAEVLGYVDGDGTVALNESAIPDGRTIDDIIKVSSKHSDIFNDESAIKQIINIVSKVVQSKSEALAS